MKRTTIGIIIAITGLVLLSGGAFVISKQQAPVILRYQGTALQGRSVLGVLAPPGDYFYVLVGDRNDQGLYVMSKKDKSVITSVPIARPLGFGYDNRSGDIYVLTATGVTGPYHHVYRYSASNLEQMSYAIDPMLLRRSETNGVAVVSGPRLVVNNRETVDQPELLVIDANSGEQLEWISLPIEHGATPEEDRVRRRFKLGTLGGAGLFAAHNLTGDVYVVNVDTGDVVLAHNAGGPEMPLTTQLTEDGGKRSVWYLLRLLDYEVGPSQFAFCLAQFGRQVGQPWKVGEVFSNGERLADIIVQTDALGLITARLYVSLTELGGGEFLLYSKQERRLDYFAAQGR